MGWVKIDDRFFDHMKARAVGKDGRALFIAGLCHAADQLTDGVIADTDLALVAAKAEVRPQAVSKRLLDAEMWHRNGHVCDTCPECPSGHYLIHDYHAYQPSAEQERKRREALSEKRSAAGRKGAEARWGDGKQGGFAMANGWQEPWQTDGKRIAPSPSPSLSGSSSVKSESSAGDPTDDDRVLEAARLLALVDLEKRNREKPDDPVRNRDGWLQEAFVRRCADVLLASTAEEWPEASPEELRDLVLGDLQPFREREHCEICDDRGLVELEDQTWTDCECKSLAVVIELRRSAS